MTNAKVSLLVVDDEASIRTSLSLIFGTFGYSVRTAEDGFAALKEIRNEIPDIVLSDLNMPHMSGFELLSVVRRRFPAISVIAMSGAYSGDEVPPGIAADAFFEKGNSPALLVEKVRAVARIERPSVLYPKMSMPAWIAMNGHDPSGEEYVLITCPECLRASPQVLGKDVRLIRETRCAHCFGLIQYAIVQPAGRVLPEALSAEADPEITNISESEQIKDNGVASQYAVHLPAIRLAGSSPTRIEPLAGV